MTLEIFINGFGVMLFPMNTCFKNNKGIGRWLNIFNKWLIIPRTITLVIMTVFFFSFETDVCFCDGRHYFVDHCIFTGTLKYECDPEKANPTIVKTIDRVI